MASRKLSARPGRFSALRARLVLWSLLVNAVLLIAFGTGIWFSLHEILDHQLDDTLQLSAAQLASALDVANDHLVVPAEDAATVASRGVFGWILNANSRIDYTIGHSVILSPPTVTDNFQTLAIQGNAVRIYRYDLKENSGTIVLGMSFDMVQRTLQTVLFVLAVVIPLALLISAFGSIFLASRALRPIAAITAQAQRISRENLTERLSFGTSDEIGQLAYTFDQMLDRLQTAFEHQQQFVGNVSHELRTPLSMLKAQISLALSRPRDATALITMLHAMENDTDRMTRLIDRMLTLIQAESPTGNFTAVHLGDLFNGLFAQMTPFAAQRDISFVLDTPPDVWVAGDADQLTQLFLNLLDNALKYSDPHSQIAIRVTAQNHQWRIDVIDHGVGIASEHLPRLHERFYRVDASRTRETGGVGLGLSIAYAIVQQHSGRIVVESKLGQGSTFSVFLPVATQAAASINQNQAH